jgi:hypothetical protein
LKQRTKRKSVFLNFDAIDPKHYMADVGNLILPAGAGGEDDDLEAVTAEQDGKSNLLGLFLEAIMPVGWTTVFIQTGKGGSGPQAARATAWGVKKISSLHLAFGPGRSPAQPS